MTEVPTITAHGWSKSQIRAYVIADNKLAQRAGWDEDLLREELAALHAEGFEMDLTGFDATEIETLLQGWNSDIDVIEKHGEHTDGITAMIKIRVAQELAEKAVTEIKVALMKAGVEVEII